MRNEERGAREGLNFSGASSPFAGRRVERREERGEKRRSLHMHQGAIYAGFRGGVCSMRPLGSRELSRAFFCPKKCPLESSPTFFRGRCANTAPETHIKYCLRPRVKTHDPRSGIFLAGRCKITSCWNKTAQMVCQIL